MDNSLQRLIVTTCYCNDVKSTNFVVSHNINILRLLNCPKIIDHMWPELKKSVDTNVFISGIFFSGPPSIILQAWRDSKIQIILSKETLEEYQRVAEELSSKFPAVDIDRIIELLTIYGEVSETKDFSVSVCEDSDDNKFIECAIASNSKLIVSGDKHLLNITDYQGVSVLKQRDFIDNHLK